MPSDRFHKAAKDGMIEILKEATKRDCNQPDEQGMTPTLYAAFYGHLEALRILCGRGGDPDKADLFGNTALHLAAAQGHKHIVTFLVNFGANIYSIDIDGRTAQELAGMNNREDILRYLDGVHAKLEASDKKKAKALKERAKKDSEERAKTFMKIQKKKEQAEEKLEKLKKLKKKGHRPSMIETLKIRMKSGSMGNLIAIGPQTPRPSYSAIVGNGTVSRNMGSVQRKVLANRTSRAGLDDDFKISEVEDGKRSVRSLTGIRRDSEVLYTSTIDNRRGRLDHVFNEAEYIDSSPPPPPSNGLTRSISQPDFMHELETNGDRIHQEPASIFVRPGIGTIAFRKSITNTFYSGDGTNEESSIGSGESYGLRTNTLSIEDELTDPESSDEENPNGPLERFLTAWGIGEYLPRFEENKIDLQSLMLLSEKDLERLGLPLGPHRILEKAISERRAALENPGEVTDSIL